MFVYIGRKRSDDQGKAAMRRIERATRAELRKLAVAVAGSALAQAAIDLAARLDADPADSVAVLLVRELRLVMADLRSRAEGGGADEVERFLARIATPDERNPAH
jgi:hypothetical protein